MRQVFRQKGFVFAFVFVYVSLQNNLLKMMWTNIDERFAGVGCVHRSWLDFDDHD